MGMEMGMRWSDLIFRPKDKDSSTGNDSFHEREYDNALTLLKAGESCAFDLLQAARKLLTQTNGLRDVIQIAITQDAPSAYIARVAVSELVLEGEDPLHYLVTSQSAPTLDKISSDFMTPSRGLAGAYVLSQTGRGEQLLERINQWKDSEPAIFAKQALDCYYSTAHTAQMEKQIRKDMRILEADADDLAGDRLVSARRLLETNAGRLHVDKLSKIFTWGDIGYAVHTALAEKALATLNTLETAILTDDKEIARHAAFILTKTPEGRSELKYLTRYANAPTKQIAAAVLDLYSETLNLNTSYRGDSA